MKNYVKAALYTAGTLAAALITLVAGNAVCEKRERKKSEKSGRTPPDRL